MSVFANLDAVLVELGQLGLRAEGYLQDGDGDPGVVVVGRAGRVGTTRCFSTDRKVLEDRESALEWAVVVATLAREASA